jgi:ribosomal protein S18 acetylase RimI-like enzyme
MVFTQRMVIRFYTQRDRATVTAALRFLPRLYPKGNEWLDRRLGDVESRRAHCWVVHVNSRIAAVAIETPKQPRRTKLSTFWVAPCFRRIGIGRSLLCFQIARWLRDEQREVTVTVDTGRLPGFAPLFAAHGFDVRVTERSRYGDGRDEAVLVWTPDTLAARPQGNVALR